MLKRKYDKIRKIKEDYDPGKLIERVEDNSDPVKDAIQAEEDQDQKRNKFKKYKINDNRIKTNY